MDKEGTPSSSQRPTRKERRAAARKQKKELASKSFFERHLKAISAGTTLAVGGALVVGGVIFLRGQDGRTPLPPTATAQQANSEQSQKANEQIIAQEVKRLRIAESQREQNLWASASFDLSDKKIPVTETTIDEALRRVQETISLMQNSENPYYKNTANSIMSFTNPTVNKLNVIVIPDISTNDPLYKQKGQGLSMGVTPTFTDGSILYELYISGEKMLNNSNAPSIARGLVHELEHVDIHAKFVDSLDPSLDIKTKFTLLRERMKDPQITLTDEAKAYGVEADALIYNIGLGINNKVERNELERAAFFISSGKNAESDVWKTHIASQILSMDAVR